jgi:hypothetical protein
MDAKAVQTSESVLLAGMDLTEEDIERRKAFLATWNASGA